MNKLYVFLLVSMALYSTRTGAQLQIGPGTSWTSDNATSVVLENTGLSWQGNPATLNNSFRFTGNSSVFLSGSTVATFREILLAMSGTGKLQLQQDMTVSESIRFLSGHLDLNNHTVFMTGNALLIGETGSAGFTGGNGGNIRISANLNAPNAVNPGNLGAVISSSQNLGTVTILRSHQVPANAPSQAIFRTYSIEPANNSSLNATLRFSYFDEELNGINENFMVLWKSADNINWTDEGADNRDVNANYVEKNGIGSFSSWILAPPSGAALPLSWNGFSTKCSGGQVMVRWQTLTEYNTLSYVVQRSADGAHWSDLTSLPAAGFSNQLIPYSYQDLFPLSGTSFYRVLQKDRDGRSSFSPVLRTACGGKEPFRVYPTIARDLITLSVPYDPAATTIQLRLLDTEGRTVRSATLPYQTQQVSIAELPAGIYLVELKTALTRFTTRIIRQ